MATTAATRRGRKLPNPESAPHPPQRWWQWFLVYPTFAIALFSAAPNWLDKVKGYTIGVSSAAEARKQAALWQKNRTCAGLPFKSFVNPRLIAVDATICDSGDILVHAVTPQNAETFKWVAVDDIVPRRSGGLIPSAQAATLTDAGMNSLFAAQVSSFNLAQFQVNILCQRPDGRYLHRRVATPQGCFQETIDTFTGQVVERNPAPCVPQC